MNTTAPLIVLFVYALVLFAFYWVVRLAVRHAIQDADRRRGSAGAVPPSAPDAPTAD